MEVIFIPHKRTSIKPLYKVKTKKGDYAFVYGLKRARRLSKNLKSGVCFNIPKSKKVHIIRIKKPTESQRLEARINELLRG